MNFGKNIKSSTDDPISFGHGKYGFFGKLWNGISHRSLSHWAIMTFALVPLILVQQVSRSMIEGIALRIIETDSYHILFEPRKPELLTDKTTRTLLLHQINSIEGITHSYEELRGVGIIRKDAQKTGISIRGVSQDFLQDEGLRKYLLLVDGTLNFTEENEVILGKAVAKKISAQVGDDIQILTSRRTVRADSRESDGATAAGTVISLPKISRAKVVGIISTGYEELDKSWVISSIGLATKIIPQEDQYWYIGMKIADPFSISNGLIKRSEAVRSEGKKILAQVNNEVSRHGLIHTWYSINYSQYALFSDTKKVLSFVMLIAVMLAAVTLSSTMSMKVIDMEIDIAMLKNIGASPQQLELQIFWQGFKYGAIGSLLGCAIGIILVSQINTIIRIIDNTLNLVRAIFGYHNSISILNPEYYLSEIPFRLYPLDMLIVIISAIFLSILAAWTPARKLRKISPLKIIRRH